MMTEEGISTIQRTQRQGGGGTLYCSASKVKADVDQFGNVTLSTGPGISLVIPINLVDGVASVLRRTLEINLP